LAFAEAIAVYTAEERGPCGPAAGGVIELCEAKSVMGQLVKVRGIDFAAEATEIGESHVIGQDNDDVRTRISPCEKSREKESERFEEMFHDYNFEKSWAEGINTRKDESLRPD
jgi:hypothetical protein